MSILHRPYLFLICNHGMKFVLVPAGEIDGWLLSLRYGFVYKDVSDTRTYMPFKSMVDSFKVSQD